MSDDTRPSGGTPAKPVPTLHVSGFQVMYTGTDFAVVTSRLEPHLDASPAGTGDENGGRLRHVAVLAMSPQAAKDLATVLGNAVRKYEAVYGPLQSDFLKGQPSQGT